MCELYCKYFPIFFLSRSATHPHLAPSDRVENWVFVIHFVMSVISSIEISCVHIMEHQYGYLLSTLPLSGEVGNSLYSHFTTIFLEDLDLIRSTTAAFSRFNPSAQSGGKLWKFWLIRKSLKRQYPFLSFKIIFHSLEGEKYLKVKCLVKQIEIKIHKSYFITSVILPFWEYTFVC